MTQPPAIPIGLDDFGDTLGLSLHREPRYTRDETRRKLYDAMGHRARGDRCVCGGPLVAIGDPEPGQRSEVACGDGWVLAARMVADAWRQGPADRIAVSLTADEVERLVATLQGWLKHRADVWLPANEELQRLLAGEPA